MLNQVIYPRCTASTVFVVVGSVLGSAALVDSVVADGWHNPVLYGDLDQWTKDVKAVVKDFDQQLSNSTLRSGSNIQDLKKRVGNSQEKQSTDMSKAKTGGSMPGGNLRANLTPQQQAVLARKANDCLQVLAFMKEGNIIPREFPNFPLNRMGEFRRTAKQLLGVMGTSGQQAVLGALTTHLMSGFSSARDVSFHPDYVPELLQVLGDAASRGTLTPEELDNLERAMQGAKPPDVRRLVEAIDATLSKTLAFQTLMDWAAATNDKKRKADILSKLRTRIKEASPNDLQKALVSSDLDARTKTAILRELKGSLAQLSIAGLLKLMYVKQAELQQAVEGELRSRSPSYQDLKNEILQIWDFADSPNKRIGSYAQYYVAKAFQDAPIAHCLYWLGQGDAPLRTLIWTRLDARNAAASETEKSAYVDTVFKAWEVKGITLQNRKDCLELLGRLKHTASARPLVDRLLTMPRELLPVAGRALKSISGQDYGPQTGDGIAEVTVAAKNWRGWLERNGL